LIMDDELLSYRPKWRNLIFGWNVGRVGKGKKLTTILSS
jgi:hypothetical protein